MVLHDAEVLHQEGKMLTSSGVLFALCPRLAAKGLFLIFRTGCTNVNGEVTSRRWCGGSVNALCVHRVLVLNGTLTFMAVLLVVFQRERVTTSTMINHAILHIWYRYIHRRCSPVSNDFSGRYEIRRESV